MSNGQHYVRQPAFLFFIRIAQIVISVIVLGLSAYALDYANKYGSLVDLIPQYSFHVDDMKAAFGYPVFVVIYTWIAVGYNLATSTWFIGAWNCWAVLALEIVGVILWLACFALLGSWASDKESLMNQPYSNWMSGPTRYPGRGRYNAKLAKRDVGNDIEKALKGSQSVWQSSAAASGIAAIIWILSIITLVVYSIYLHRHRINPENEHLPADGSPLKIEEHAHATELKQQHQGYVTQQPVA